MKLNIQIKNSIHWPVLQIKEIKFYLNLLKSKDVGLVSEAGTPWLSDPGKVWYNYAMKTI